MASCEDCRHERYELPDRSRIEKRSLARPITFASPRFRSPAGKCHDIFSVVSLCIVWFHPDAFGTIPDVPSRRDDRECTETRHPEQLRAHALLPRTQNAGSLQEYLTRDERMTGRLPLYLQHLVLGPRSVQS